MAPLTTLYLKAWHGEFALTCGVMPPLALTPEQLRRLADGIYIKLNDERPAGYSIMPLCDVRLCLDGWPGNPSGDGADPR